LVGPELERIYTSRPDMYPLGARKSKRQTSWADQVIRHRVVFVGEGPLEMAAAFDNQEMANAGIRSIINVPIVIVGQCVGVLNFARDVERISPAEVLLGRFLGVAATQVFLDDEARAAHCSSGSLQ
jgi:GAF domain-containing protein